MKYLILLACLISNLATAQCLEQKVSLLCSPCTRESALEKLQEQINCSFSFNASKIDPTRSVDLQITNTPLYEVLDVITNHDFQYKQRGRHVMLLEKEQETTPRSSKKEYVIEGYVRNALTGDVLSRATIYTVGNKYAALTDETGFYQMSVQSNKEHIGLSYSKQSYLDTIIVVSELNERHRLDMALIPRISELPKMPLVEASVPVRKREVEELPMVKILVPEVQTRTARNLEFLESVPIQLSIIPSVGTGRLTSGVTEHVVSLNLFSGYNAGIKGVEFGSLVNIIRMDVEGFQLGGLGNIVGGKVSGAQVAGLFNNVRGSVDGWQTAGIYNIVLDTINGIQSAGIFNVLNGTITGGQIAGIANVATENMEGLQAAGIVNITQGNVKFGQVAGLVNVGTEIYGAQVAGVLNYSKGNVLGAQLSGLGNIAEKDIEGAQLAGLWNTSKGTVTGSQFSGFLNSGKDVKGTQMAGFLNSGDTVNAQIATFINAAKTVNGMQFGFLNFSDTTAGSFGFLSFSLKGVHHIDVGIDEIHPVNVSLRTGSQIFYNIIHVGFGSFYPTPLWSYGYGVGTHLGDPKKRSTFHAEVMMRQLIVPDKLPRSLNLNFRFEPSLSIQLGKRTPYLVVGPSFNFYLQNGPLVTDDLGADSNPFSQAFPPIFKQSTSDVDGFFWFGGRVALRL